MAIRGYSSKRSSNFNLFPQGPVRKVLDDSKSKFSLEFSEYNNKFAESQKQEEEKKERKTK